jgi:excinuclease UvrABC nuclease subunit
MIKLRFLKPYIGGKTRFPDRGRAGVYLISENGQVVYIGYSANDLYKTLYRHFQTWNHDKQFVVSYKDLLAVNDYRVRVVYCTALQAVDLEKALIIKYKPRDNFNKYPDLARTEKNKLKIKRLILKYNDLPAEDAPF